MVYLTDYSEKLDYYTPVLATSEKMIAEQQDTGEGVRRRARPKATNSRSTIRRKRRTC